MSTGFRKCQRALRAGICGVLAVVWLGLGPLRAQDSASSPDYQRLFSIALMRLENGRPMAAQWWLRRAFRHAKTDAELAALREVFQYTRDASPLALNFGFNVAPSNNVNDGSTHEYLTFEGILTPEGLPVRFPLPADRRPLSGTEASGYLDLAYRLSSGPRHRTSLSLYLYGRTYQLSSESRAAAPDASGSDYAYVNGDLALRHQWLLRDGLGPTSISVSVGRVESGREPWYRYRKVSARQDFLLRRGQLGIGVSFEDQESQSTARADAKVVEASAAVALQTAQGNVWRFTLQARETRSFLDSETFQEAYASASVTPNWRVFGAVPTVTLGLGAKNFDDFVLDLEGQRDDRIASLGLSLRLDSVSVMGFSPVFNVTGTRTRSNVAQYDTEAVEASLGLHSQF